MDAINSSEKTKCSKIIDSINKKGIDNLKRLFKKFIESMTIDLYPCSLFGNT